MSIPGEYSTFVKIKKFFFPTEHDKAQLKLYKERVGFYRQFIPPGAVCYDVGANFGSRTKVFLQLGAKVVALEPQRQCYEYLLNRYERSAVVLQKGVGSKNEIRDFFISDEHAALSSFSENWINDLKETRFPASEWNRIEQVEIVTLDELVGKYGNPAFIKIDVEGFELEVLKGLSEPFSFLSFEYAVPEKIANVTDCLSLLGSRYNKLLFNYSIEENTHLESPVWMGLNEMKRFVLTDEFLKTFAGDIYVHNT
jgi:FkbM family methyltransferase